MKDIIIGFEEDLLENKKSNKEDNAPAVDSLKVYLNSIGRHPRLTAEQERALSEKVKLGDKKAENTLVECNLLLVVSIAKTYYGCGMPLLDLIQEGNLGLMKAAQKYDGSKGFRFSTYATYWIKQSISRALAESSRTIRLPGNRIDLLSKVKNAMSKLSQSTGEKPSIAEIADYLEVDVDKIQTVLEISQTVSSLDTPVDDEGETCICDLIPDVKAEISFDNLVKEANSQIIEDVLNTLSARECNIIKMRFGIGREKAMTLEEVGNYYGLTKERIRQVENKALRKLRNPVRAVMLQEIFE